MVGVLSRHPGHGYGPDLEWGRPLPEADIALIAVRDDAIVEVVERLPGLMTEVAVAAHLSGFVPATALNPLKEDQVAVGGFHPLQSLPDAERGARALRGAFAGIGGDPLAVDALTHLAGSLGMTPFRLEDAARPAYHAAAAAASNFVVTALAISADLCWSAGVDPKVSRPLVERAVANAFDSGPASALTGPISRGDIDTVIGHLTAARDVSDLVGRQFSLMAEATTIRAGREEDLRRWK
jgi:predicted short-subunit dehydrogenase-like oxidoreductase (DUF2520 family)